MLKFSPNEQTAIYNRLKKLKGGAGTELEAQLRCFRTSVMKYLIQVCRAEKVPPELLHAGLGSMLNWAVLQGEIVLDKCRSLPLRNGVQKLIIGKSACGKGSLRNFMKNKVGKELQNFLDVYKNKEISYQRACAVNGNKRARVEVKLESLALPHRIFLPLGTVEAMKANVPKNANTGISFNEEFAANVKATIDSGGSCGILLDLSNANVEGSC